MHRIVEIGIDIPHCSLRTKSDIAKRTMICPCIKIPDASPHVEAVVAVDAGDCFSQFIDAVCPDRRIIVERPPCPHAYAVRSNVRQSTRSGVCVELRLVCLRAGSMLLPLAKAWRLYISNGTFVPYRQ